MPQPSQPAMPKGEGNSLPAIDGDAVAKPKSYGRMAAKGFAYTSGAQFAKILLNFVMVVVVARLIPPDEYGVSAMAGPVTGLIIIFQNLGLNQAIVQAKTLRESEVNALFWYNLIASLVIALALCAIAPFVALFYDDNRAGYLTAATAATVLVTGLSLQHTALMNREMRFQALAVVDVLTAVSLLFFTTLFAALFHNYWALWAGVFGSAIISALLLWQANPWRPSTTVSFVGTRNVLSFGASVTGFNLTNFISRNVDNILIAKQWGAAEVGLYDRSYKLMMFPLQNINQPLGRVMLPILSRLREEPGRYRDTFLFSLRVISLLSVPGVLAAAMCSDVLIPFLLGSKWTAAAPIFFWLSLAAVTQPVSNATGWLFMSTGRPKAMMQWSLVSTPIVIVAFIIGLPWGAAGVAAAYFISQVVRIPILYYWCTRKTPVAAWDLYAAMIPTLLGGGIAWVVISLFSGSLPVVGRIAAALILSYAFSTMIQFCTPDGRKTILRSLDLLRALCAAR